MSGIYWYVSRQKVDALRHAYASRKGSWIKELSLKLKVPFAEASATFQPEESLYKNVEQIRTTLLEASDIPAFPNLPVDGVMPFFTFSGGAQRAVDRGAYWIAMMEEPTALLLGGSVKNAIGAPSKDTGEISPSVDPIWAVKQAFKGKRSSKIILQTVSERCSYVWQVIAGPVRTSWKALPKVEGVAVYGGTFPASEFQLSRAGFTNLNTIVVASPIYVRQI